MKIALMIPQWNLIGARDLMTHLLQGMASVAHEHKLQVFVFLPEETKYTKYEVLYRVYEKIRRRFPVVSRILVQVIRVYGIVKHKLISKKDYTVSSSNGNFEEFDGLTFISYPQFRIYETLKAVGVDFFFPHLNPHYFGFDIPNCGYIYDCQHKYHPEFFSKKELAERDRGFQGMLDKGPVIVNARQVKYDLQIFYRADPEKIFVLPFTPKLPAEFLKDEAELLEKYVLPAHFLMNSNQFWLHKDHPTLFRAFARLVQEPEYQDLELICTGTMEEPRKPGYIDELKALIKHLGIDEKVRLLGLIPKREQIEIMKHTSAVVQTTLFEGGPGGGSVWDACALGVPSVISDIPVNLEIAGYEEVTFFRRKEADDLAEKIKAVLQQPPRRLSCEARIRRSEENIRHLGEVLLEIAQTVIKQRQTMTGTKCDYD